MPDWVVERMPWTSDWNIDHEKKTISPKVRDAGTNASDELHRQQSRVIAETLQLAREKKVFAVLNGWRNELYPIGRSSPITTSIERAGSALFGIVTYGVHMTAYVKVDNDIKIWVPRRAKNKQTFGGMLDNTVAGGISSGENPFESVVREAAEEASFPDSLVRSNAKSCGMVTYFYITGQRAGGETGLLQPEVQYVYDLEIDPSVIPKPADDEVEEFYLWTVEEVQKALAEGQFKPNCAVVLLDFFVRHGILTADNEKHLIEIVSRIHRKLPFPTA
ncbi:hypothetical protein MMC22_001454 [Lobaria immixta]|nr:hypothetical protein [Lobaria immixta]